MPNISLVPTRAVLAMSRGESLGSKGDQAHLTFKVSPESASRKEVRLSSGEKFSDLDGSVILHPGDPPPEWPKVKVQQTPLRAEQDMAIVGTLTYCEKIEDDFDTHPASYTAEVWVAPSQFDQLVSAARQGKLPTSVSVDVVGDGIKYGWEPDGSGKDWDNKAKPQLPIVWLSFGLLLAARPSDIEEEPEPGAPTLEDLPPTRAQAAELLKKLEDMSAKVSRLPMKFFWAGVILVLALIFFGR